MHDSKSDPNMRTQSAESLFSDLKSRGFGLMQSQIKKPDRLERLILIMSLALY